MTRAGFRDWAGRDLSLWLAITVPAAAATTLTTQILRPTHSYLGGLLGLSALVLCCAICWSRWAPSKLRRIPMLAVINLLALGVGGLGTSAIAPAFTGLFMLTFCFVGLTRPPRTSLLLAPLAACSWLVDSTPTTTTTLAKLPVAVGSWILVSELIASYRAQQRTVQRELERQLEHDTLTGLKSRRSLNSRLDGLAVGDTVIFLDLDHFKGINDTMGHDVGDEVLIQFARAVLTVTRREDEVIRYGGEEVLVLIGSGTSLQADELLTQLREIWRTTRPGSTFSAGISCVWEADQGGDAAVRRADAALYQAKNAGRDCWRHASPDSAAVSEGFTAVGEHVGTSGSGGDSESSVPLPRTAPVVLRRSTH